jgi:hypothetical protein
MPSSKVPLYRITLHRPQTQHDWIDGGAGYATYLPMCIGFVIDVMDANANGMAFGGHRALHATV